MFSDLARVGVFTVLVRQNGDFHTLEVKRVEHCGAWQRKPPENCINVNISVSKMRIICSLFNIYVLCHRYEEAVDGMESAETIYFVTGFWSSAPHPKVFNIFFIGL